ncbi:MAG: hypothetical protein CVV50_03690 [Spirochaetae bacterium HGW-Spirochaetae-6]|nr:MAG: hypothetical protein CVV50_03690 [Spirochaetae bacterium HGW-Spirochaetae-6]
MSEGFVCREFPGYVYAHVNAGRAKGELSGFTYVYKAVGSNNDLGTSAMAEVTLRETQEGYFELGSCQSVDAIAPTVSLTAPANGAVLSGNVSISADAADNVGVAKVEFFANTTLIAEKTAAPYSFSWNTASAANGSYALKAKASDAAGNTKEHSINITVDNGVDNTPPQVNITAPSAGSTVSGSVSVSVTVSDDRGVARVEYFANNSPIGTSTVAPFGLSWDTSALTPGSYALKAVAYDGAGNSAQDNDTTVSIEAGGAEYDKTNGLVKLSGTYSGLNSVYKYIPAGMKSNVAYPLIVVAHGCLETAQQHSDNSEWTKLADKYKFFLIYPEETSQIGKCLDWWTSTSQNGGGDTGSTIQAVKDLMGAKSLCAVNGTATKCKVDANKVFVNGFSAGGGLAIQMLAVAPTLFKKGAIHAGVPYKGYTGSDTNSLGYINGGKNQTPAQWAALMPQNPGTYPPIIVFHGEGDTTVNYTFMNEIMEQWTEVHGIDRTADNNGSRLKADDPNHTYNEYHNASGEIVVATVSIKGKGTMKMTHRVAVDPNGTGVDKGGNSAGTYAEDAGLYAAYYALKFFGIIP